MLPRAQTNSNPKRKMTLIFCWYLGLSSRWPNVGKRGGEWITKFEPTQFWGF
ncbi:MAG: trans-AT polyketide synthase/acyltransferase/oxidoreductase domain-containing protein [Psychromonas sp.]|jgi:trans-AT polyketide synthase/acyltransferase/oxidoreductase domain-containing protein